MGIWQNILNTFRSVEPMDIREMIDKCTGSTMLTSWLSDANITKSQALEIPAVKSALNLIKNTVRTVPIRLYKKTEDGTIEVEDSRVRLLNTETGDTLSASEMWDAVIEDYFLNGSAYIYINSARNKVKSLHYVDCDEISVLGNNEPIFKDYYVNIRGKNYFPYQFLKIHRDTKNGFSGVGIVAENSLILRTVYNSLKFENNLVATGGNKKGYVLSEKPLDLKAMQQLKESWKKLYSSNDENIVVLNNGLKFQESSNNSVELQLATQKELNDAAICRLFSIPVGMMAGASTKSASAEDKQKFLDYCIIPILEMIECSLNRDLLLESAKTDYFFKFDTKDILKGSLLERMQAYEIAKRNNFMLLDEIRSKENLPATGLTYMDLGLSSVLYDIESDTVFVPNTGSSFKMEDIKSGKVTQNDTNQNSQ